MAHDALLKVSWSLKRVRHGRHVITVVGRDDAGNIGKRTVAVRVRR